MYLIYFDETGDTGINFNDEQQPVFVLGAMQIEQSQWKGLEKDFLQVLKVFFNGDIPADFELHTMDLVSSKRFFNEYPQERLIQLRDSILEFARFHGLKLVYRKIVKKPYQKYCEKKFGSGVRIDPYIMALPFLCTHFNGYLEKNGSLGIQIIDKHRNLSDIEKTLKTLQVEDGNSLHTANFIEKGFFVDSSRSWPIQVVDLILYYVRKLEESKIGKKVSPIHQETFPILSEIAVSLDQHDRSFEIIDWVGKNQVK